jgi:Fe-S-cluster containining protein
MEDDQPLAAGDFAAWLVGMQRALGGEGGSDVPCGGCTACCRSSQFVHIGPDESDTLAHIPAELLFPAPRSPKGNVVLGYDQNGHCPMLIDDTCSIYEHRPKTCRTYDCRVFPATGVEVDDGQPAIAQRVRRWSFSYATEEDRALHDAVRAAARFVVQRGDGLANAIQRALDAIESHEEVL